MAAPSSRRLVLSGAGLSALLVVAHGANDGLGNILPTLLPTLQARFGLSETALAVFVALVSLSANVLQPLLGGLSDRWGRRRVGGVGLMATSLLMSLLAVAPSVWLLYLLLVFGGLGSAAFHPAATSMARSAGRRKSLAVGLFTAGGPVGSAVGPVVVLAVLANVGPEAVPLLSLPGLLLGLALLFLVPRQETAAPRRRWDLGFDVGLLAGPVGLLALVGILRSLAFVSFVNAIPLWLVNVRGFAPEAAAIGWTLAVYSASAAVSVALAGAVEPRLGRRPLVVGSMLLALPALLAVFLLPPGGLLFFCLVATAAILTNAAVPGLIVSAQDLAPQALAAASGLLMGFTWGTAGVLYIGIGWLQEAVGITAAMSIGYGFLLPAALLGFLVVPREPVRGSDGDVAGEG